MSEPLLMVDDLCMHFGGVTALSGVSLSVQKNSITALIGPNGAGKTTLFNCLTGFYKASSGLLLLAGEHKKISIGCLLGQKFALADLYQPQKILQKLFYKMFGGSHWVCRHGIARTFQNIRLFKDMTVIENCLVAQHMQVNRHIISGLFNTRGYRQSEKEAVAQAYFWLEELGLSDVANQLAGSLSYGNQRRLEIARAMCTKPQLICLDEPAAGLNPKESESLRQLILKLKQEHQMTVLLIEHDMQLVMNISDHIVVLDHGEVIAKGDPDTIREHEAVINAYLGNE